jgi:hypothetical protein
MWGWIAIGAADVSAVGYAVQTILDYVPAPALVGQTEFYGVSPASGSPPSSLEWSP